MLGFEDNGVHEVGLRDMIREMTAEKGCREQRFAREGRLFSGKQDSILKNIY
jgi:hypothetical protein